MLKQTPAYILFRGNQAATFGWLCVETGQLRASSWVMSAATFGWLCVETERALAAGGMEGAQPPSGGCVLKLSETERLINVYRSHLRVAVC